MSRPDLNPVSFVVLGLLARDGPATPYDLKRKVDAGIAAFWSFPQSQLYSETKRLAAAGLLEEDREATGRRRRTYAVNDAGRSALRSWLAEPVEEPPQIRSSGLLKLFFGYFASDADLAALARAQQRVHEQRLARYAEMEERLAADPARVHQLAVLSAGLKLDDALLAEWRQVERRATTHESNSAE